MKVTLRFNDEKILTELYFDGQYCTNPRLKNCMFEKPAEKWLNPFSNRHVVWKGFLNELSEVFNTRNFIFQIFGTPDILEQFQNLIQKIIPANFNVSFEFEETNKEEQILDAAFVAKIISMLRQEKSFIARQLRLIQKSVDKINCQVIYENYRESHIIRQMFNLTIQFNSLEIAMPTILISDKNFSDNPYEICRQHQIEPSEAMIIAVEKIGGREDLKSLEVQLKQQFKDIPVFWLKGLSETDNSKLAQISRLYNAYKKKFFRKIILSYPDEIWTEPKTLKNFIATL